MPKLYLGLGLILLPGLVIWYVHNQSYQSGINAERVRWQDEFMETAKRRAKAEKQVVDQKPIWRDRIKTIQVVPDSCIIPDSILGVHRESGIYTGR